MLQLSVLQNAKYHIFICCLQHDVIQCAQQVEMLESQLAGRMEQLQNTVQSKTAVPTAQVYVSWTSSLQKERQWVFL